MGSPYTSVSVSGYNSNPPPDDGSTTSANEILWATIKTKLPDPLKTALEAINTNVASAINALAGGITSVSTNYTVLASDQGKIIKATASGITITSPDATSVASPFKFGIVNVSTGDITFDPSGSQTIDGNANIIIPKTRGLSVDTDGSNWVSEGKTWHSELIPNPFSKPSGRLTLLTATPVLTSDQIGKTTLFYTPHNGNTIMLPDANGDWTIYEFSEVSQTLADNTKSPAATSANNLYDIFGWLDGTIFRATRGPSWSTGGGSATARGTGAGSTALTLVDGVLVNSVAISNGPSASRGVYLGTIATDGSNQLNMMFAPAAAAGGGANRLDVYNHYNQVDLSSVSKDSTDTWTYTTKTWRAANNNNNNRVTFIIGVNEQHIEASYTAICSNATNNVAAYGGIGLDSTSALSGAPGIMNTSNTIISSALAKFRGLPGLGQHYVQALEASTATGTTTWYGDNGADGFIQMVLSLKIRM